MRLATLAGAPSETSILSTLFSIFLNVSLLSSSYCLCASCAGGWGWEVQRASRHAAGWHAVRQPAGGVGLELGEWLSQPKPPASHPAAARLRGSPGYCGRLPQHEPCAAPRCSSTGQPATACLRECQRAGDCWELSASSAAGLRLAHWCSHTCPTAAFSCPRHCPAPPHARTHSPGWQAW